MKYTRSFYVSNGTTAIEMWSDNGEPWATVTVNLQDYGMIPEDENHIYIPAYKLNVDLVEQITKDLVEEVVCTEYIGYNGDCKVLYARLRPDWKEICEGYDYE